MNEPAKVGVVVLDMDQGAVSARCLQSLANGNVRPVNVVLVVNSNTRFDTTLLPANLAVSIIDVGRNLGCASGRNLGVNYLLANTGVDVAMILDNDTVAPADFVEQIANDPPPEGSATAPVIFDFATGAVWSNGGHLDASGSCRHAHDEPTADAERVMDWTPGACIAIPRSTWAGVGQFDSFFEFMLEDVDWCRRVREHGGTVRIRQGWHLRHEANQSLEGATSPARTYYWSRNTTVFRALNMRLDRATTARWVVRQVAEVGDDLQAREVRRALARVKGLVAAGRHIVRTSRSGRFNERES